MMKVAHDNRQQPWKMVFVSEQLSQPLWTGKDMTTYNNNVGPADGGN